MFQTIVLLTIPLSTFAYENIALHKSAWQLYPYNHYELGYSLNASKAVDGLKTNLSYLGIQCTESSNYKDEAMWRVDLGSVLGIHHITIYYRTDNAPWGPTNELVKRFLGFSVFISNTTERKDGVLCFKDNYFTKYTIPSVITLNCTHHGRYVIYYNNRTSSSKPSDYSEYAYNELCEFEVYGCPTSYYFGEKCSQICSSNCKYRHCHIETGHCFGCIAGYQGPMCEHPCQNNRYGAGCSEKCGHCLNGKHCNHINGACPNGCESGYYNSRCGTECPTASYGRNCLQKCSKNCYVSNRCDRRTGVCDGGCVEGWKPPLCNEGCDDGTFGTNCSSTCGHCHKGQSCDKKTGACPKECDPGYEGLYCNKTCARPNYGPNCNLTCSTYCVNQACDLINGACLTYSEEIIEGTSTAIGGTIGVFLVIAIITVVAIIYKRNNITICRCIIPERSASKGSNNSTENTSHVPKTYMDLKKYPYNEIDENVYEKIKSELPMENTNVYEQFLADIPLNNIGSVKIDKGNDNSDGLKKDLASLPRGEQFSCDTGKLLMSSEKNRVQSSLPYDLSKMIFRRDVGISDDYVNVKCGAEWKNS